MSYRHRSEEHTSELQSLTNLVCRLLLEKRKLSSLKKLVRPSFLAFFLHPASVSACTAGSCLRPAPGRGPSDAYISSSFFLKYAGPARIYTLPHTPALPI